MYPHGPEYNTGLPLPAPLLPTRPSTEITTYARPRGIVYPGDTPGAAAYPNALPVPPSAGTNHERQYLPGDPQGAQPSIVEAGLYRHNDNRDPIPVEEPGDPNAQPDYRDPTDPSYYAGHSDMAGQPAAEQMPYWEGDEPTVHVVREAEAAAGEEDAGRQQDDGRGDDPEAEPVVYRPGSPGHILIELANAADAATEPAPEQSATADDQELPTAEYAAPAAEAPDAMASDPGARPADPTEHHEPVQAEVLPLEPPHGPAAATAGIPVAQNVIVRPTTLAGDFEVVVKGESIDPAEIPSTDPVDSTAHTPTPEGVRTNADPEVASRLGALPGAVIIDATHLGEQLQAEETVRYPGEAFADEVRTSIEDGTYTPTEADAQLPGMGLTYDMEAIPRRFGGAEHVANADARRAMGPAHNPDFNAATADDAALAHILAGIRNIGTGQEYQPDAEEVAREEEREQAFDPFGGGGNQPLASEQYGAWAPPGLLDDSGTGGAGPEGPEEA